MNPSPASPLEATEKKWNYGIELLRMVAMFLVCVLHTMGQGGVLLHCEQNGVFNSAQYYAGWFVSIATYCCVDVYALISGYVGYKSRFKPSRMLYFFFEVLFYTLCITAVFAWRSPELVTHETWVDAIHPLFSNQYWYMTAYLGLLIVSPILGAGIRAIDEKYAWTFLAFVLVVFCLFPILFNDTSFLFANGYSFLWLIVLYCLGGLLAKNRTFREIPAILGVCLFLFGVALTYRFFRLAKPGYTEYTSPTVLIEAIGLLIAFQNVKIKNRVAGKLIRLFGEATLGVYLIHTHPLVWAHGVADYALRFGVTNGTAVVPMLLKSCGAALLLYVGCSLADILRILLCRALRLQKGLTLVDRLYDRIGSKPTKTE